MEAKHTIKVYSGENQMNKSSIGATVFLACASLAQAAIVSYTTSFSGVLADISTAFSITPFDPNLGALDFFSVSFTETISTTNLTMRNLAANSQIVKATISTASTLKTAFDTLPGPTADYSASALLQGAAYGAGAIAGPLALSGTAAAGGIISDQASLIAASSPWTVTVTTFTTQGILPGFAKC
jgi:hypothetical protein